MAFLNLKPEQMDPTLATMEQHGYLIEVLHIGSGKVCSFPSWITEYSDNYTSEWKSERIFGRNDAIGSFIGVSRKLSLALEVPSFSVEESRENLHQLEHLFANLYPSYRVSDEVQVMKAYPLVKVRFANLIKSARFTPNDNNVRLGLTGWIDNVNYSPVLEAGFHHPHAGALAANSSGADLANFSDAAAEDNAFVNNQSHTFYPKTLKFSFSLSVVHEHELGWNGKKWLGPNQGEGSYTGITLSGGQHAADNSAGSKAVARGQDTKVIKDELRKRTIGVFNP